MNVRNLLCTLALVTGWSSTAVAVQAVGPVCNTSARVLSTAYYSCTDSTHFAVDVGSVPYQEPLRAPLVGSHSHRFTGGCTNTCNAPWS